ncbi:2-hydroxyacid dehydrogenase [Pseudodonghicola xiamenensis]|uniref:Glyoxylate/hydroxypyruvate reductase A n=1 Tax=Pseudodonghicola xiamenensis TaxID=337702 RepID=A0A8J3HAC5_9RHOB|nr:glyoxylate/hydroxypyruvate reductase A [Pseudodonghicola xiamenensis]GHG96077.1 glyoxylate/hydroxypyruvate reductase A [Pseudodonghicola xiamenensis]
MALLLQTFPERAAIWSRVFSEAGEPLVCGADQVSDPAAVRYLACWVPPPDLTIYPNLEVVISVGAGVDQMPKMPEGVRLCRTLAPGIEEMVRDWVVMATLMLYRAMPVYLEQATRGQWQTHGVPLARNGRVGIMGMGRIGQLAAETLTGLGFQVSGWSRSGAPAGGVEMFSAEELDRFLGQSDVLICLLPLTGETRGMLNANLFAKLPEGAHLVHAGRGAQLHMPALRAALDTGRLASAMLDVTEPEPLPQDHWAWADPRVIITPHVAANTDHREGAEHALRVVRAARAGQPLPGLVDQARGY